MAIIIGRARWSCGGRGSKVSRWDTLPPSASPRHPLGTPSLAPHGTPSPNPPPTPQRIRTAAALNYHIYPYEYDNVFDDDKNEASWGRQQIFDDNQGHAGTLQEEGSTGVERAKNNEKYMVRQQEKMKAFLLSDVNTQDWDPRHTPEDR
jgi:hypothetical protein